MSGRVFVVSHPRLAGYLKIIAFGGIPLPTDTALDDTADPNCQFLFHVVVGRPSEVSRRAWHELRYCPGTAGWLQCSTDWAILTLQRVAEKALEEEKHAAWMRSRQRARRAGAEPPANSDVVCRLNKLRVTAKRRVDSSTKGTGQALAMRAPNQQEICSACRSEVPPGTARCVKCGARLIRF